MKKIGANYNRRDLLRQGGMLAAANAIGASAITKAAPMALEVGPNLYESIGVRPIINARGTFTIITGSQTLPEVKQAMVEASRHYVQMDEVMKGVGQRLVTLTGAEWGMI